MDRWTRLDHGAGVSVRDFFVAACEDIMIIEGIHNYKERTRYFVGFKLIFKTV